MLGPDTGSISNVPKDFEVGPLDMVPLMGGHAWNVLTQPSKTSPWVDPIWIMSPFDGKITNFEPMIPLSFVIGSDDKVYGENLTYVGQTMKTLLTKYMVKYDATSTIPGHE